MREVVSSGIIGATFRANPQYELVLFDRLPPAEQAAFHGLQEDPDFYGLLVPRERVSLGVKSVCRDTALLFLTLREPGRVPAYFQRLFGERSPAALAELVLDGVLEIESCEAFASGPEAYRLIYTEAHAPPVEGTIASLSIAALQYAQALDLDDSRMLSARLYCYHRQPASPRWRRAFPTPEAVADYLGIRADGPVRIMLEQHWSPVTPPASNDGWLYWNSRYTRPARPKSEPAYKLYLSPACDSVPEALHAAIAVLSALRAPDFKIGRDVYGLLRPDKIIIYFENFEALHEAVDRLGRKLAGCPAHGVPFTAEIGGDGLLSWGIDPPPEQQTLPWLVGESWRLWVTNRLATALLAAKSSRSDSVPPWRFALERLRLDGVDTDSWTPTKAIWAEETTAAHVG